MKNRGVIAILVLVLVALPVFGACKEASLEKPIELTYNNFFPPTHLHSILAEEWIKEVEVRTEGQVKITYYSGGGLAKGPEVYNAVIEGICDIGMSVLAYTMGRFPATELVDLPHGYPNGWVATKVANDYYDKFKPAEFDDVQVLYFHAHGPGVIFTTKVPVRKLEDLKGLVLRSTGVGAKIAEALGAEGYGAPQGEALELMSKGTIDGSVTPREVLKGWNQAEVVKYVTGCYDVGYTANMFVVMNKAKWDSLPRGIKKIFTEVSEEWAEKHGMVWDYYDKVAVDYFLSLGEGREIIELSSAEMARWVEAAQVVKDVYMEEKGAMGLSVEDFEDYLNERVAYWSKRSPAADESVAWVNAELEPLVPKK